jgi:hypothetical protein
VWGLWMKVPALMWLAVLALDTYVTYIAARVH